VLVARLQQCMGGNFVLMLPDQVPQRGIGKFAPFFGEPAYTMTLATKLLQRTGAKAVCGFCKRLPDGKYELAGLPRAVSMGVQALQITAEHGKARLSQLAL